MDLYANVVRRMDLAFENYLAQDNSLIEPDDIPKTNSPVWILGRRYNAIQGNKESKKNYNKNTFLLHYISHFIMLFIFL